MFPTKSSSRKAFDVYVCSLCAVQPASSSYSTSGPKSSFARFLKRKFDGQLSGTSLTRSKDDFPISRIRSWVIKALSCPDMAQSPVFRSKIQGGKKGGGWGKEARKVWSELAKLSAHAAGELDTESGSAVSFLQRFAKIPHRENAKAVLRRLAPVGQLLDTTDIGLDAVAMEVSADT